MTLLGELALWTALMMALWSALVSYAGAGLQRRDLAVSGARALHAAFAFVILASAGLWAALFAGNLSIRYVAGHTTSNLPTLYKLSAFWAGYEGSMLLWCLALAAVAVSALRSARRLGADISAYVAGTLAAPLTLLLAATALGANPFELLGWIPPEGRGLDPLLQHPAMVILSPALYLGYAAAAVPFAFAIAALLSRRFDAGWLAAVRRWSRGSWLLLTIAIALRLWWSYSEPALEARWVRTAVDNASLLPWLTGTALAHSLAFEQKRAIVRRWNIALVAATFVLSVLGAIIAIGGVTMTLGSFVRSSASVWFALFAIVLCTIVALLAIPRASEPPAAANAGAGRRVGGHLAHVGAVLVVAGLVGAAFGTERDFAVAPGASFDARDPFGGRWTFTSQGVSQYPELNRQVTALVLEASRDGAAAQLIKTEQRQHVDHRGVPTLEPSTEPGILGSLRQDVYVVLERARRDEHTTVTVAFHPLVRWVWLGATIMIAGGMIAMLPSSAR